MSGQTTRILPRTDYNFTVGAAAQVITVVVARKLDTSRWREGVLLARLHACASWPAGSMITVVVAPDAYTDENPAEVWNVATTTLLTFEPAGSPSPTPAPYVQNAELPTPFGPLLQIKLLFTYGGNAGLWTPSMSIDLNLKGE